MTELFQVCRELRRHEACPMFESGLRAVHAELPVTTDDTYGLLAGRFDAWRQRTEIEVRRLVADLTHDDPLLCPISLFRTLDYGRLETAHTRALAWLLDPTREHGFGAVLLEALLQYLSDDTARHGIRVDRVASEFHVTTSNTSGRLDVIAEGQWQADHSGWVLLIEAKIDAGEQQDQLRRYEAWARANTQGRDVFRVFLTPDGRTPETGDDEWVPISYTQLVRIIRTIYPGLRGAPGFCYLRFYLAGVLQDVCHWPRGGVTGATDPYAVADYLRAVRGAIPEDVHLDAAR